jgi:hypothetical protein
VQEAEAAHPQQVRRAQEVKEAHGQEKYGRVKPKHAKKK